MAAHGQAAWPLSVRRLFWLAFFLLPGAPRADPILKAATGFASAARALDPVNFVMAQGDLAKAANLVPAAGPPASSRSALMRLFFQDSSEERRLHVAPIRWRGSVSLEQRFTSSDNGTRRAQSLEYSSVEMATYVGQPWLAQVRANLGILAQQQRISGQDLAAGSGPGDRGLSITGGATLSVFPSSRFPFVATFDSSDSRTSGEATAADYISRMLALRQGYRSPLGDQSYAASLERSTLISDTSGRDSVTAVTGSMQRSFSQQAIDVSGSHARNRRSAQAIGSDVSRLSARHSYRPGDLVTLDSYASFSMSDLSGGESGSRTRYLQWNSFGSWRPDEESPLYVTGGVRVSDAAIESGAGEQSARSLATNLAMSYALTPHATLVASGNVARVTAGAASRVVTAQSVAASYTPAPLTLGLLDYSWGAATSLANQTGGDQGRALALSAQGDHRVSKAFAFGPASLTASLNQGLAVRDEPLRDPTTTLMHSASLGMRFNPNAASDLFASLSAGESRSRGGNEDRFQLLNLQLSGHLQLGVYSAASANLTMQAVRQRPSDEERARTTVQRSGTLSYQHMRLFGVRRLRLVASATFNDLQLESRLQGDPSAPLDQITRLLEQRLDYDIGRLDFRLGTRLATNDGRTDRQVFLRVSRQFGLY